MSGELMSREEAARHIGEKVLAMVERLEPVEKVVPGAWVSADLVVGATTFLLGLKVKREK